MSEEEPPIPFPLNPIYNPNDWRSSATFDALDIAYLNSNYLKYPLAQAGTETLNSIIVNGTSSLNNNLVMSSNDPNQSQITCGYLNFKDLNGNVARTAEIYQDSANLIITNEATSGKTQFNNDTAGGIPTLIMELDHANGITSYRPFVILANNNLTMNSGTGKITQPVTTGDLSTKNNFKLSEFSYNSNNLNGTGATFEFFDNVNGKGLFLLANSDNGTLSQTNRRNDCCLTSRSTQNNNSIVVSNWNDNMRNGLRVATTDINNCELTLQCGQNSTSDYAEFKMAYNRNTLTTTTTFNNVINFNPTTPSVISGSRRALIGLGTLSFTDVCGNNTTTGSTTSAIWTDSSGNSVGLNTPTTRGMFYDCSINNGSHIFRATDNNIKKTFMTIGDGDIRCYSDIYFNGDANVATGRSINYVSDLGFLNKTIGNGTLSSIYTTDGGMFFDCGVGGAGHNFRFKLFDIDDNYISGLEITPTDLRAYESLNFNSTNVANRNIGKVGTLGFLDLSANSTEGTTISSIWTDSSLVDSLNGMYYDCGINSGFHQFRARDSAGIISTPIYYGSNITSVSNTFIIRSSVTPSNRFDIVTDSGQNTNIRARSTTASTNALININCDEVNAGGTTFNRPVMTIAPTNIEVKRPIQFNYTTTPNASTQLGYVINPEVSSASLVASSTSVRNFGSFTITNAGTYNIQVLITLAGGANHTLTENRWCIHTVASAFPSITTPTKTTPSITGVLGTSLSSTLTAYVNINLNVTATAGETYYINYVLNYSGGSNTTVSRIVSYARIG